jgi:hypothetical protein
VATGNEPISSIEEGEYFHFSTKGNFSNVLVNRTKSLQVALSRDSLRTPLLRTSAHRHVARYFAMLDGG